MLGARLALVSAALYVGAACNPRGIAPPPAVPSQARASVRPAALEHAVAAWHERDDIEPLRAWVDRHAQASEAELWREVVALHDYDECRASTPLDESGMREVARRFPDTIAGRTAIARLSGDGLTRLRTEIPSRDLVDFLEGGDAWARTNEGELRMPAVDLQSFRNTHADELEQKLARKLVADRCRTHMAYCNWWIERRPAAAETPVIAEARKQAWYDRGHPTWQGGAHARCAYRCAKTCREAAAPLDDGCYGPCYARCR